MKRIISLCLVLTLFVFAAACKEKEKKVTHDVDLSYFADMGALTDSDLKIGDDVPGEENNETYFFTKSGDKSYFSNGDFCYYYDENEKDAKIYGIAAFSKCLGFETGSIIVEITDALDSQEIKYSTRTPAEGEIFFLPANKNREIVECNGLKYKLIFVFEDNALCAAYLGK